MANKVKASKDALKKAAGANVLQITDNKRKSRERLLAEVGFSSCGANADTARTCAMAFAGELHISDAIAVLQSKAAQVQRGDLSDVEATLTAQAVALDSIFNALAKRAALNMGQYMEACETYLRLALKAQAQCRATLETLAEVKYPKAATFVRQQNVAYQQQVNNGDSLTNTRPHARAEEKQIQQNELLEDGTNGGTYLDTGATTTASGSYQAMETMGTVHRANERQR